jgi:hypothetical protein
MSENHSDSEKQIASEVQEDNAKVEEVVDESSPESVEKLTVKEAIEVSDESCVLEQFLRDEIQRERDSLFWTRSLGGGFAVFVFFYLWTFVYEPFKSVVLNPENLGRAVVYSLDENVPVMLEDLEASLTEKAPGLAEKSARDIRSLIPLIGEQGVEHVDVLVNTLSTLDSVTISLTDLYFDTYGDQLRDYIRKYGRENFVEKFADDIISAVVGELEEVFELQNRNANDDYVNLILGVASEIERLAEKDSFNMTLAERLQRRLIVAWTHYLADALGEGISRENLELLATEVDMGRARMEPTMLLQSIEKAPGSLANYSEAPSDN